jgi:hypothetical protein
MGLRKKMAEILMFSRQNQSLTLRWCRPVGKVLEAWKCLEDWKNQLQKGLPLTVTEPR